MADPEELTPDESWEEWKKDREKRKARLEATSLKAFQALPVEVTGDDKEPKPSAPTLPRPPPRLGSDLRPMTHPTTGEDIYMSEAAYDAYARGQGDSQLYATPEFISKYAVPLARRHGLADTDFASVYPEVLSQYLHNPDPDTTNAGLIWFGASGTVGEERQKLEEKRGEMDPRAYGARLTALGQADQAATGKADKMRPEAFEILRQLSSVLWGRVYRDEEDLRENWHKDFNVAMASQAASKRAAEKEEKGKKYVGITPWGGIAEIERTANDMLNEELSKATGGDIVEQILYRTTTDPEVFRQARQGTPQHVDAEVAGALINDDEAWTVWGQHPYNTTEVEEDVVPVPIAMSETGTKGIDLQILEEDLFVAAASHYIVSKGHPLTVEFLNSNPDILKKARQVGRDIAETRVALIRKDEKALVIVMEHNRALQSIKDQPYYQVGPEEEGLGPWMRRTERAMKVHRTRGAGLSWVARAEIEGETLEDKRMRRIMEEGQAAILGPDRGAYWGGGLDHWFRANSWQEVFGVALKLAVDDMNKELADYTPEERRKLGRKLEAQKSENIVKRALRKDIWGTDRHLNALATMDDGVGYYLTNIGNIVTPFRGYYRPDEETTYLGESLSTIPAMISLIFDTDVVSMSAAVVPGTVARIVGGIGGWVRKQGTAGTASAARTAGQGVLDAVELRGAGSEALQARLVEEVASFGGPGEDMLASIFWKLEADGTQFHQGVRKNFSTDQQLGQLQAEMYEALDGAIIAGKGKVDVEVVTEILTRGDELVVTVTGRVTTAADNLQAIDDSIAALDAIAVRVPDEARVVDDVAEGAPIFADDVAEEVAEGAPIFAPDVAEVISDVTKLEDELADLIVRRDAEVVRFKHKDTGFGWANVAHPERGTFLGDVIREAGPGTYAVEYTEAGQALAKEASALRKKITKATKESRTPLQAAETKLRAAQGMWQRLMRQADEAGEISDEMAAKLAEVEEKVATRQAEVTAAREADEHIWEAAEFVAPKPKPAPKPAPKPKPEPKAPKKAATVGEQASKGPVVDILRQSRGKSDYVRKVAQAAKDLTDAMKSGTKKQIQAAQRRLARVVDSAPEHFRNLLLVRRRSYAKQLAVAQNLAEQTKLAVKLFKKIAKKVDKAVLKDFWAQQSKHLKQGKPLDEQGARLEAATEATRGQRTAIPRDEAELRTAAQQVFRVWERILADPLARGQLEDVIDVARQAEGGILSVVRQLVDEGDFDDIVSYLGITADEVAEAGGNLPAVVAEQLAAYAISARLWDDALPLGKGPMGDIPVNDFASRVGNVTRLKRLMFTGDPTIWAAATFRVFDDLFASPFFEIFRRSHDFFKEAGEKLNTIARRVHSRARIVHGDINRIAEQSFVGMRDLPQGATFFDTSWGRIFLDYINKGDEQIFLKDLLPEGAEWAKGARRFLGDERASGSAAELVPEGTRVGREVHLRGNLQESGSMLSDFIDIVTTQAKHYKATDSVQDILGVTSFILDLIRIPPEGLKRWIAGPFKKGLAGKGTYTQVMSDLLPAFYRRVNKGLTVEEAALLNIAEGPLGDLQRIVYALKGAVDDMEGKFPGVTIEFINPLVRERAGDRANVQAFKGMVESIAGSALEKDLISRMLRALGFGTSQSGMKAILAAFESPEALKAFNVARKVGVDDVVILKDSLKSVQAKAEVNKFSEDVITGTLKFPKVTKKLYYETLDTDTWKVMAINKDVATLQLVVDPSVIRQVNVSEVAFRPEMYSMIDLFDAAASWGLRYLPMAERHQWANNTRQVQHMLQTVARSALRRNGLTNSISMEMRNTVLRGLDLHQRGLLRAIDDHVRKEGASTAIMLGRATYIAGTNWWRAVVLNGFTAIGVRTDRPMLIFLDDLANVWVSGGSRNILTEGVTQLGFSVYGQINAVPLIGERLAKWYASGLRKMLTATGARTKIPLPSAIHAMLDNPTSALLAGEKGAMETAEGVRTFAQLRRELVMENIDDNIRSQDLLSSLDLQPADWFGTGLLGKAAHGVGDAYRELIGSRNFASRALDDYLRDLTLKQRAMLWLHLRSAKGGNLPMEEATRITLEALYDWTYAATSGLEREILKRILPWYVWQKNVMYQTARVLFNPGTERAVGDQFASDVAKYLRGGHAIQRLKVQYKALELIKQNMGEEMLTDREEEALTYLYDRSPWMSNYHEIFAMTTSPEVRKDFLESMVYRPDVSVHLFPIGVEETAEVYTKLAQIFTLYLAAAGDENLLMPEGALTNATLDYFEGMALPWVKDSIRDWRQTGELRIDSPEHTLTVQELLALQTMGQMHRVQKKDTQKSKYEDLGIEDREYPVYTIKFKGFWDKLLMSNLMHFSGDAERRARTVASLVSKGETADPRFRQILEEVRIRKGDEAAWLMNYLVVRGYIKLFYYDGAERFLANEKRVRRLIQEETRTYNEQRAAMEDLNSRKEK